MFKTASASVAGFAASVDSRGRTASRVKVGSFEYEPAGPDYLYVSLRALSADRPNLNMDMFPSDELRDCLLYTSPSPRDKRGSRMPSSA